MRKKNRKPQAGDGGLRPASPIISSVVGPTIDETHLRIRMLRSVATAFGALNAGTVHTIPAAVARPWIAAGIAEQDKSLDGPSETK